MNGIKRNSRGQFIKGVGFWTGKKRPNLLKTGASKTMFKKGFVPWNKGKKWIEMSGSKNPAWIDGRTPSYKRFRRSFAYQEWRRQVLKRDNYACIWCGQKQCWDKDRKMIIKVCADHIKPFSLFPRLRLDINNGRTLCLDCHKKTNSYNNLKMTREMFL